MNYTDDQKAVVFERAAELLEEKGWIRNDYGSSTDGYCAVGAIREACREELGKASIMFDVHWDLAYFVYDQVMADDNAISLVAYNDVVAKDKRYITRRFRKAARLLRGEKR